LTPRVRSWLEKSIPNQLHTSCDSSFRPRRAIGKDIIEADNLERGAKGGGGKLRAGSGELAVGALGARSGEPVSGRAVQSIARASILETGSLELAREKKKSIPNHQLQ